VEAALGELQQRGLVQAPQRPFRLGPGRQQRAQVARPRPGLLGEPLQPGVVGLRRRGDHSGGS
jgi:hypothetical protein